MPRIITDVATLLHEFRLRKDDAALDAMRRAISVSSDAHIAGDAPSETGGFRVRGGGGASAVLSCVREALVLHTVASSGPVRMQPFCTIVTTNRRMEDGDLLLIDAGCELGYHASDITRTFPVSGRFKERQRAIYDVVLKAQIAAIDECRPGNTLEDVHRVAVQVLTEGMVALGLLDGPVEQAIETRAYREYYMHRTSHWLGMDVHDVGLYQKDGKARPLEPRMVLTVEPGLYLPDEDIGIRIEDDVLITENGCEVLSGDVPKDPDEIESLIASR